jgi:Ig-like domain from next to BRCA1 gene
LSESFTKTWRIQNVGSCAWTTSYEIIIVEGEKMGGPGSVSLPASVAPGSTIDISVNLITPTIAGKHQSYWMFQTPNGARFGVGPSADKPIWVKIRAIPPAIGTGTFPAFGPSPTSTIPLAPGEAATLPPGISYDFAKNACAARWESNKGFLPCPGLDGDINGFVVPLDHANLEDGTTVHLPTLLTFPQYSGDGYIQGTYPEYEVQPGDHFQTTSSCEFAATSCSVLFQLSYLDSRGIKLDLWTFGEFFDGKYFHLDLDLSQLAEKKVSFVLRIYALGSPVDDRALWIAPQIVHFPVTPILPTPTSTARVESPTATLSPSPTNAFKPALTPTPTSGSGNQNSPPSLAQIVGYIVAFLKRLLGK